MDCRADFIRSVIESLSENRIIEIYKDYCEDNNIRVEVNSMSEFDTLLRGYTPSQIVGSIDFENFVLSDNYLVHNLEWDTYKSYCYWDDFIELSDIVDWIDGNLDRFNDFLDAYSSPTDFIDWFKYIWEEYYYQSEVYHIDDFINWYEKNYGEFYTISEFADYDNLIDDWIDEKESAEEKTNVNEIDTESIKKEIERLQSLLDSAKKPNE